MHIHSYQIHNVLNLYHRQLSQGTARGNSASGTRKKPELDRIDISSNVRSQSLFDKISSEIVERITRFEPVGGSERPSAGQAESTGTLENPNAVDNDIPAGAKNEGTFTYTLIDEHNQKTTQKLPIRHFNMPAEKFEAIAAPQTDVGINSETE